MAEHTFDTIYATQPVWDTQQGAYRVNMYFDTGERDTLYTTSKVAAVQYMNWCDNWQLLCERTAESHDNL